jgi:hypothetical protein
MQADNWEERSFTRNLQAVNTAAKRQLRKQVDTDDCEKAHISEPRRFAAADRPAGGGEVSVCERHRARRPPTEGAADSFASVRL